jgi:2-polyprenyl-3-methyl-5-hydroxy-6-metoxy-1,4-benzoquinol methylase
MPARDYHESSWERIPPGLEPVRFPERLRFALANIRPGQRVLDLGCGEGRFAQALAAAGAEVVCADVAQEPLRRVGAAHPALATWLLDGEGDWGLADASFDAVWAGEVIEHVADTGRWLSELRRVLRPHGTLLLSTPAHGAGELLRLALSARARERHLDPRGEHLRFYTAATLRALVADFGFEQIEVVVLGGPLGVLRGRERTLLLSALRTRF